MTRPFRFLGDGGSPPAASDATSNGGSADGGSPAGSDFVLILAALLCALICVLGLVAVARCACLRRPSQANPADPKANRGLKKKILRSLPKLTIAPESAAGFSDCAICLGELAVGDEIRVLPQCGHAFHVTCVDTWLRSHSSCPSCRQILAAPAAARRCEKCGSVPAASSSGGGGAEAGDPVDEARLKRTEDDANRFLP
ncbi:RING-H2 finger protein ATL80-like [Punica granatum]|uniref:RING-type domain-containing protein n=2 Tax=Punica granatum TaxID=22663 RepID=A0A218X9V4_PUNGR|nr:RING-H2 finger protein ATL80-like [Punica granatum]OWM81162.1 hypothetical protein CDL15_Pgr007193 [Punica granatum]PKI71701.1 hypothetical protein CRG98_007923 [Punica granatum]